MTLSQGCGVGNTDRRRVLEESTLELYSLGSGHMPSKRPPLSPLSGSKEKFPSPSSGRKAGNCLERIQQEKQGKVIKQRCPREAETQSEGVRSKGSPKDPQPIHPTLVRNRSRPPRACEGCSRDQRAQPSRILGQSSFLPAEAP